MEFKIPKNFRYGLIQGLQRHHGKLVSLSGTALIISSQFQVLPLTLTGLLHSHVTMNQLLWPERWRALTVWAEICARTNTGTSPKDTGAQSP